MNNQKGAIVGLVMVILILTVALTYVLVVKKAEAPSVPLETVAQSQKPVENKTAVPDIQEPIVSETPVVAEKKIEDKYAGWPAYRSDRYNYEIRYPSGMKITEAKKDDFGLSPDSKMTFDEAYKKYTGQVCVTLENKKGSILISAPGNEFVICSRTGLGANTKIKKYKELITVDGKEYSIDVSDITDPAGNSIEAYIFLPDGTQIMLSAADETGWIEMKKAAESFHKIK